MTNDRRIQNGVRMLHWIEDQGVVFYTRTEGRETAKRCLRRAAAIFPDLVSKLSAVYLFRQSEQSVEYSDCDGLCWWREMPGGIQYAVGLAVEALEDGKDYFVGLFLHELAHVTNGPHTMEGFYTYLDEMAEQYRRITGEPVFPDHHDFEPAAPLSGPGRPRKTVYYIPAGHSAKSARRKMIARQHRTARGGV